MIDINLLPEALRKKKRERLKAPMPTELLKVKFMPVVIGAVGLLILLQLLILSLAMANKAKLKGLGTKEKLLSPNKRIVDALKEEEKALSAKGYYIDEIYNKRLLWSKKLNDLSDSVTTGIWFYELSMEKAIVQEPPQPPPGQKAKKFIVRSFLISGRAVSAEGAETALIGKFVKSLKENNSFFSDFEDAALISSKRKKIKEVDVMEFVLSCPFKGKEEAL